MDATGPRLGAGDNTGRGSSGRGEEGYQGARGGNDWGDGSAGGRKSSTGGENTDRGETCGGSGGSGHRVDRPWYGVSDRRPAEGEDDAREEGRNPGEGNPRYAVAARGEVKATT